MDFSQLSSPKYRWWALVVLALGLAIVIIDNTVLNVAIPYILRDLNASIDAIQWVVSGYALIIATLMITMGRLGDLFGRKRIFLLGTVLFAIGSFIASIAHNTTVLFIGEALIEAIGAAMMMTNTLSLLTSEFEGPERAIAFGVWGSVAGLSATVGPLLGGYFTTYHSWRWSLRINVIVALVAILGSIFIKESRGEGEKSFDWQGTILSGFGLFTLVFGIIEGQKYGWWHPNELFKIGNWHWFSDSLSVVPVAFALAFVFLLVFCITEYEIEKKGRSPLLRMSMFKVPAFSTGLVTLLIISMGQFGLFFVLPIFLQTVLGLDALKTGYVFLSTSLAVLVFGPLSGFLAAKFRPKWVVAIGMVICTAGVYWIYQALATDTNGWKLAPALVLFGIGIGSTSAQLTNIILSSISLRLAGEASGANSTVRQIGTSIGIAVLGAVLASGITTKLPDKIMADNTIPSFAKTQIVENLQHATIESGNFTLPANIDPAIGAAVKNDVNLTIVDAAKQSMIWAVIFVIIGTVLAFLIPDLRPQPAPTNPAEATPPPVGH